MTNKIFNNKTILITGGTGSFGNECTKYILKNFKVKKLIIYSRDENKQYLMEKKISHSKLRFFLGDIRDLERLNMAMRGVDYVIHAAALKHVPIAEYNPIECIKTNIYGAQNIISSAITNNVKRVMALSTDKATNPVNLYGASKLAAEKLFLAANALTGKRDIIFSIVRYGNVLSSRGSVIPFFKNLINEGSKFLPITHKDMTRFFITLPDSVKFVIDSFESMKLGEVFVPKLHSFKITDLAKSIKENISFKFVGIRPGEKLNEVLCAKEESFNILESKKGYIILKDMIDKKRYQKLSKNKSLKNVSLNFYYSSDNNPLFLNYLQIKKKFPKL